MSYTEEVKVRLRADLTKITGRYSSGYSRSALLPMLHPVQSQSGYVSPDGVALIADILGITHAEVSVVATFYTQYKRHPAGDYLVGVCTNSLCVIMDRDAIWEAVSAYVGVGSDEMDGSGRITLERIECNAAYDYTPVVTVNQEFFDNQTPESTIVLADDSKAGHPARPIRGAQEVPTFKENECTLAGFLDGHENEGLSAGESSLLGLRTVTEKSWSEPLALDDIKGGEQGWRHSQHPASSP